MTPQERHLVAQAEMAREFKARTIGTRDRSERIIARIADVTGYSPSSVHDWALNRQLIPAIALEGIYKATVDLALHAELSRSNAIGIICHEPVHAAESPVTDIRRALCQLQAAQGKLAADHEAGLAGDNYLDPGELARCKEDAAEILRQAAAVIGELERREKAPAPFPRKVVSCR